MNVAVPLPKRAPERFVEAAVRACRLTCSALQSAGRFLLSGENEHLQNVIQSERELDQIDREIDDELVYAINSADLMDSRKLLACARFVVELERVGDLVSSFTSRAASVSKLMDEDDLQDLARATALLERMIADAEIALVELDIQRAIAILRADADIDRIRNLVFMRHVEGPERCSGRQSMHILIMMQALERSGDHAKNMAEEVCHLISGRTVRHVLRANDKPYEQLFIDWLKQKHAQSRRLSAAPGGE